MLDTDILVDLLRGKPEATAWFKGLSARPAVPGFAAMELLQGCQNSGELLKVDKLLRPLAIVWPSTSDMQAAYAHYHAVVLSSGIGLLDCLIAFTAIGRGETLCTFNYSGSICQDTEAPIFTLGSSPSSCVVRSLSKYT